MPDYGVKATTNKAQTELNSKHFSFQKIAQLLSDLVPTAQGGFAQARFSQANIRTTTNSTDNIDALDFAVIVNNAHTFEFLPPCADGGRILYILNAGTLANVIPAGVDTIAGTGAFFLGSTNEYVLILSDGVSNWMVLGHGIGPDTGGLLAGNVSGLPDNNFVNILGALNTEIKSVSGVYNMTENDCVVTTPANATFNLPAAASGKICYFVCAETGGSFQLNTAGSDTFFGSGGPNNISGASQEFCIVISDGIAIWNVFSTSRIVLSGDVTGTAVNSVISHVTDGALPVSYRRIMMMGMSGS